MNVYPVFSKEDMIYFCSNAGRTLKKQRQPHFLNRDLLHQGLILLQKAFKNKLHWQTILIFGVYRFDKTIKSIIISYRNG